MNQLELTFTFDDDEVAEYIRRHGVRVDVRFRARRATERPKDAAPVPTRPRVGVPGNNNPFGYDQDDDE
ncbi:MAG TPA: hypothetical protein VIQ54_15010 [Polyangia bacterium]|jgi:hypothetical protein